ncbi:hypothetical protein KR009_008421 [Drosophila setifemur]|nr:hypothetical protein KR009_008421 [Drosophila setifemur]
MSSSYTNLLPPSIVLPDLNISNHPSTRSNRVPLLFPCLSSLMPQLHEDPGFPAHRRRRSCPENCPLSDDEKRARIRIQEVMRNPVQIQWEIEPLELGNLDMGEANDSPREAVTVSEVDDWLTLRV